MKARLPKGMGGGPTDMNGMIKRAQKMQEEMEVLQEDLDAREYEINAGGGVVTVKITGKLEIRSIDIKPGNRRSRRYRDAFRCSVRRRK